MKKFIKVSLIVAASLFGIGVLLGIVALFGGGRAIQKEAEHSIAAKTALHKTLVTIEDVLFDHNVVRAEDHLITVDDDFIDDDLIDDDFIDDDFMDDDHQKKAKNHVTSQDWVTVEDTSSYSVDEISELSLGLGAGIFTIEEKDPSENQNIEILKEGNGEVKSRLRNGKLEIRGFDIYDSKIIHIATWSNENKLTVRIPSGKEFSEVSIEAGAGMFDIGKIKAREFDLEGGAGEFTLTGIDANKLELELGAGTLSANEMNTGNTSLSVGMGSMDFDGTITGNLDAETGMGQLNLQLTGSEEDHNYEIECAAGKVEIGNYSSSGLVDDKKINHGASTTYEIECGMGSVTIQFQ